MKLKLLAAAAIAGLFFSTPFKAQTGGSTFDEGTLVVTAGLGFPNLTRMNMRHTWYKNGNGYEYKVRGFGPLLLKADYGMVKFDGDTLWA